MAPPDHPRPQPATPTRDSTEIIPLFGHYALDLARGCLLNGGSAVHLRPLAYELLRYLAENKGRLISKEKLVEDVWEGRAVTDDALVQCLMEIRRALGADGKRFVRNVRGRGYIFDPETGSPQVLQQADQQTGRGDVTEVVVEPDMARGPAPQTALPWRTKFRKPLALGALVTGIALALVYNQTRPPVQGDIRSVAVLPFANVSGEPELDYLTEGLTEALINGLSRRPRLRVMSRSSVIQFKSPITDARAVATELGVQALVTGRVLQRGDSYSIAVELTDGRDNTHIWGERYQRKASDLASLQAVIARDVSEQLHARLSAADERKLASSYTASPEAYHLYLKGRYHYNKSTKSGFLSATTFFKEALELDPTYAQAYAGLADVYRAMPFGGFAPSTDSFPLAKAAARRALDIDPDLPEAHIVLGWVNFCFEWNWPEAERTFLRAIELAPNSSDAHRGYAHMLSNMGRHEEALAEIRRARELDPLTPMTAAMEGQFLFYAGRVDEAERQWRKTLDVEPDFWPALQGIGRVFIHQGRYEAAIGELKRAMESSHSAPETLTQMGFALAKAGKRAEAEVMLATLRDVNANQQPVPAYNFAMICNGLGNREQALQHLEKSVENREVQITFAKVDTRWDHFRTDPRFGDLMRQVGF